MKRQQEQKEKERQRIINQRTGTPKSTADANEGKGKYLYNLSTPYQSHSLNSHSDCPVQGVPQPHLQAERGQVGSGADYLPQGVRGKEGTRKNFANQMFFASQMNLTQNGLLFFFPLFPFLSSSLAQ